MLEVPQEFESLLDDPRAEPGFQRDLFPRDASGADLPAPDADDAISLNKTRYLSLYYRFNLALASHPAAGTDILENARDALEDSLAPVGFIGEPAETEGDIVRSLHFCYARPEGAVEYTTTSFSLLIPLDKADEILA